MYKHRASVPEDSSCPKASGSCFHELLITLEPKNCYFFGPWRSVLDRFLWFWMFFSIQIQKGLHWKYSDILAESGSQLAPPDSPTDILWYSLGRRQRRTKNFVIRRNGSEMQPPWLKPQAAITACVNCIAPQLKKQIPFFQPIKHVRGHEAMLLLPQNVKNCFASKNWDLLHYYLLFQDPFFCFGPHPQYRYGWIRTIGCATLHTTKKAMSDFHFEEIHKSVQLLQGAGCQKC